MNLIEGSDVFLLKAKRGRFKTFELFLNSPVLGKFFVTMQQ